MRLRWVGALALALGAVAPRAAGADPGDVATAVLGIETIDAPPGLGEQISEELRQRVAASHDLRLVSGKDLVEIKLVFACADEGVGCMVQAGKSLGAQKLIYGSVKRSGNDFAVWLKQLDVKKETLESWTTETLPKKSADPAGIKAAAGRWFAKLTGKPLTAGGILVTANVQGATVMLDGKPAGTIGEQPLTISDVAAGKHDLAVEKQGHTAARQQVMVVTGQTASVNLALQPLPPGAPAGGPLAPVGPASAAGGPPQPGSSGAPTNGPAPAGPPATDVPGPPAGSKSGYRIGFWITLGATALSAGAAMKFGLDVSKTNDDLDPYRRLPCPGGTGICDGNGKPPTTPRDPEEIRRLTDEGNKAQTLQWVFIGVGSAFAVASGYLFYKGYLDSDDSGGRREAHRGLRIFPTAKASAGGVVAEFDF
jgi:hypothetical protein